MKPVLLAAGYLNEDVIASVGRIPEFGGRVTASSISRKPGGMTANLACAATKLGLETRFFSSVGEDEAGRAALDELSKYGVDVEGVMRVNEPTTTALVLVSPDGDRAIVSEPMTFDYEPVEHALDAWKGGDGCLHVDGYRLPEALGLLRRARELGLSTSADLDGMEPETLADYGAEIAPALDIAFLNRRLAAALAEGPEEAANKMVELGVGVAVVTLGSDGAILAEPGVQMRVSALPSGSVLDTTGAGDVFAAAFLVAWFEGEKAERAAEFAVAASGLSVRGRGARGCLPGREQVEETTGWIAKGRESQKERSVTE